MSGQLTILFREILGEERIKGIFLKDLTGEQRRERRSSGDISIDHTPKKDPATPTANVSLEEMEGLLSDHGSDDDNGNRHLTDGDRIKNDTKSSQKNECVTPGDRTTIASETSITPWTLCDSWESSAIGTLPGYIDF